MQSVFQFNPSYSTKRATLTADESEAKLSRIDGQLIGLTLDEGPRILIEHGLFSERLNNATHTVVESLYLDISQHTQQRSPFLDRRKLITTQQNRLLVLALVRPNQVLIERPASLQDRSAEQIEGGSDVFLPRAPLAGAHGLQGVESAPDVVQAALLRLERAERWTTQVGPIQGAYALWSAVAWEELIVSQVEIFNCWWGSGSSFNCPAGRSRKCLHLGEDGLQPLHERGYGLALHGVCWRHISES